MKKFPPASMQACDLSGDTGNNPIESPDANALPNAYQLIYAAVMLIPEGKVATYGDIAAMAGMPNHARMVGYALYNLVEDSPVPWQRIVNSQGICSVDKARPGRGQVQRKLLEAEGIEFKANGRIDLKHFRFQLK